MAGANGSRDCGSMLTLRGGMLAALFALALAGLPQARADDAAQGKALYETRCTGCHESSVHQRRARKAKSYAGVRAQVARWSEQTGGPWSSEEIDSVSFYLNQRYYHFPCPQSLCKADTISLQIK
jgi:mono/diheme cytochrome c family protein